MMGGARFGRGGGGGRCAIWRLESAVVRCQPAGGGGR
jgi:hypothetical protein